MFGLDFTGVGANLSKPNTTSTSSSWNRISNTRARISNARNAMNRSAEMFNTLPTEIKPFPGISIPKLNLDLDTTYMNLSNSNDKDKPKTTSSSWNPLSSRISNARNAMNQATEMFNALPTEIKLEPEPVQIIEDIKPDEPRQNRNRRNRSTEDKPAQNKPKPDKTEPLQIIEDVKTEPLQIIEDIKPDKPGRNEPKPNKPGQNRPKPIKPVKTEPITVLQVPNITDVHRGSPLTKNVSKGPNNTMLYIAGAVGSVGVIGLGMYFMKSN